MIIDKIGKYKLIEDIRTRNSSSIGTLKKGTILDITQIDKNFHKVIGESLMDWTYWDLPVEPVENLSN